MNDNQIKFRDFFLSMVQEGKLAKAEEMLTAGFQMQAAGRLNSSYLHAAMPEYLNLIKPECEGQLIKALYLFATEIK